MCELGATWINQKALVPVIVPPLDYHALDSTPYRSWNQIITLDDVKDLQRIAEAMIEKGVGKVQMVRFNTRAEIFNEEILIPFVNEMSDRKVVTLEELKALEEELAEYREAIMDTEKDLAHAQKEIEALRQMKDTEEIQV
ncbi:hypothetical protein GH741_11615 [Aquibacillus halophilus]|uniref:Uncharacterized protein n=1 Tax=Aquibacillus halophilus TaxID=930132 RepID=A0A6A8DFL5_9BACI|nr:hypothetical protein [Aquibacillus halophilus]MRH43326.1 hypothetical protein [Aquibacillus halophilus]